MRKGRTVFDNLPELGFPSIVSLARNNNLQAIRPLKRHVHEGSFEILYLAQGTQVWGASGRGYLLSGNDLFITQPGERHSTGPHPVSKSLFYWIQLRLPKRGKGWAGLPERETRAVIEKLRGIDSPCRKGSPKIREYFETCLRLAGNPKDALDLARLRHGLVGLLLEIVSCLGGRESSPLSEEIELAVKTIGKNIESSLRASDLTGICGLSESRLRARFRQETGVTIGQYIMRAKIERSMELLQSGMNVTDVAYQLSFSSSQYFATVFKQYTMRTPSEFIDSLE